MIDLLSYTYGDPLRPDRLTQMADGGDGAKGFKRTSGLTGDHYLYDLNGNMTQDKHKNFSLSYNYLNLPQSFTQGANAITMTYTADGEKLTKALTGGGATKNYVGGIEYSGANLEAIYFSEGRCTPNGATAFFYEYTIKDHLGNARVSFRAITNGTAIQPLQENHYYPFGMEMEGTWLAQVGTENQYEYNGKELNEDFGLNLYDYGVRWYDAALGRWGSLDPIQKFEESLYSSFSNNPIILIDPIGADTSFSNVATKNEFNKTYDKVGNKISSLDKKSVEVFEKWRKEGFDIKSKHMATLEKVTTDRSELIEIKESLDEIIQSTTMFFISGETNADGSVRQSGGSTEYNHLKNRVDINYGLGNDHSLVHEARHGAGYLRGEWGSNYDPNATNKGKGKVFSYDYQDEYEGYRNGINYLRIIYGQREVYRSYSDYDGNIKNLVIKHYSNLTHITKEFRQICTDEQQN